MLRGYHVFLTVQQPEVHLHPKAQAAFGGFLFNTASSTIRRETFLIETHSDYIIDGFRYQLKKAEQKVLAQVLFFKNDGEHNNIETITIQEDGKYGVENLTDFREFYFREAMRQMEI
jgi:predicted ATPase